MPTHAISIRAARPEDAPLVHNFILAIADYEKLAHEVAATAEDVRAALAGEHPRVEVLLADWDGQRVALLDFGAAAVPLRRFHRSRSAVCSRASPR